MSEKNQNRLPAKQQQLATLSGLLNQMRPQLKMALPRHLTPDRLIRVAITAWHHSQGLQECSPMSILGAIVQAAQLGLEPDNVLGHAYLVPFYNSKTKQKECTLITGYKGLLDLARRSGQIEAIESHCVREKDHFIYRLGLEPELKHVPSEDEEQGDITHAWAIARFKGGGYQCEVMTRREIDKIRKGSKAADTGPWSTHYEEMARKTVLRRLCKFLPLSPEIQRQISAEEMADAGVFESAVIDSHPLVPTLPAEPKAKTDKVAEKLGVKANGSPAAPAEQPSETTTALNQQLVDSLKVELDGKVAQAQTPEDIQESLDLATANQQELGWDWYDDFMERCSKRRRELRKPSKAANESTPPLDGAELFAGSEAGPYATGA